MKFLNGTYTQYYNRQHHRATAGYDESDTCLTTEWILAGFSKFAKEYNSRDECMAQTYLSGHYTLAQVGGHFGVSYATVSRAVKLAEKRGRGNESVKCKVPLPLGVNIPYQPVGTPLGQIYREEIRSTRRIGSPVTHWFTPPSWCWASFHSAQPGWQLDLDRRNFMELLATEKTQERIEHMLKNRKPLRN